MILCNTLKANGKKQEDRLTRTPSLFAEHRTFGNGYTLSAIKGVQTFGNGYTLSAIKGVQAWTVHNENECGRAHHGANYGNQPRRSYTCAYDRGRCRQLIEREARVNARERRD